MCYGKLITHGQMLEVISEDPFRDRFWPSMFYAAIPPEPTHCGYCARRLKAGETKRHSTCPTCAGGWEEAVVDLEAA